MAEDWIAEAFADLFAGRMNAYGTNEGGCDKIEDRHRTVIRGEPLLSLDVVYQDRIDRHLHGVAPMGVYPLTDDLTVRWGCTDLDYIEDPTDAYNLATLVRAAGCNAFVERSRSKGFHVWTFAMEPIAAPIMRDALLAAHQMLEIPATEVNPKQTTLEGLKGFGNYVRLPYPGALSSATGRGPLVDGLHRQTMMEDDGSPISIGEFVERAAMSMTDQATYEALAAAYVPPPPPRRVSIDAEPQISGALIAKMGKPAYLSFRYGPREGHDRSSSLARLAYLCHEDGLNPAETLAVIRDADLRWGKFFDRADCEDQLMRMVTNAHRRS